jgi:hypothetical protein
MSGDAAAGSPASGGVWEVLAVACELAMLAALAVAGWLLAPSVPVALALAFTLPALTGLVWGMWLAPRARHRLREPALTAAKVSIFLITGLLLAAAGQPLWGMLLTAGSVASAVMLDRRATGRGRPEAGSDA